MEAAEALRLTAPDLINFGVVDEIVAEPIGGAHTDHPATIRLVDAALSRALEESQALPSETRLEQRYAKFRSMGKLGGDFVDS